MTVSLLASGPLSGVKISELDAATLANDSDELEVNQAGVSRKVTVAQIANRTITNPTVTGDIKVQDAAKIYTPFNGPVDTGTIQSGIQFGGTSQIIFFFTANTSRGYVGPGGTLGWLFPITCPTPATITNDTTVATTAYVKANIAAIPSILPIAQADVTNLVSDLALKAPLASPALTGNPTAPTPATADNDTSIATTAMVQAAIAAAIAAIPPPAAVPVGTVLDLLGTVAAPAGWVLAINGTIGNGASGATIRANADCANLFAHLWTLADTEAPVSGGRGASAAADFAANKTIGGLDCRGTVRGTFDSLGGAAANRLNTLFPRVGMIAGEQAHALITAELAAHNHGVTDPTHFHTVLTGNAYVGTGAARNGWGDGANPGSCNTSSAATGISIQNTGSGTAHNNVQFTRTVTTIVKL